MNKTFPQLTADYDQTRYERIGNVIGIIRNRTVKQLNNDLEQLATLMLDYDDCFIDFLEILTYSGLDDIKRHERNELVRFSKQICDYLDIRITGSDYNLVNLIQFIYENLLDDVDFEFCISKNGFYEIMLSESYHGSDVTNGIVMAAKYNAQLIVDRNK